MPFDGDTRHFAEPGRAALLLVRSARLSILLELCCKRPRANQRNWKTCLWSEAVRDESLIADGIGSVPVAAEFFGLTAREEHIIFGSLPKCEKRPVIAAAMHRLETQRRLEGTRPASRLEELWWLSIFGPRAARSSAATSSKRERGSSDGMARVSDPELRLAQSSAPSTDDLESS